jgi:hypothetical protein
MHSKLWPNPYIPTGRLSLVAGIGPLPASSRELMSGFVRFMIFHGEKSRIGLRPAVRRAG